MCNYSTITLCNVTFKRKKMGNHSLRWPHFVSVRLKRILTFVKMRSKINGWATTKAKNNCSFFFSRKISWHCKIIQSRCTSKLPWIVAQRTIFINCNYKKFTSRGQGKRYAYLCFDLSDLLKFHISIYFNH